MLAALAALALEVGGVRGVGVGALVVKEGVMRGAWASEGEGVDPLVDWGGVIRAVVKDVDDVDHAQEDDPCGGSSFSGA